MKTAALITLAILLVLGVAAAAWLYTPDRPRAALEARYAPPPSQFVTVAGIRLHLRDTGPRDAPAVILLHGFGASLHTWEDWAAELERDHRVIRFDLPGFGLTGADPTGDYTDARSFQVLAALMDQLGVAQAAIIGHSMGGRIAWSFAAEQPARVTKLVLIAPDGFASPGMEYGRAAPVPAMLRVLPYVLPRAMLRMNLAPAYADATKLTEAMVTRYHEMMLAPGVRPAIIARMEQLVLQDPVPRLRALRVPTLLLWGEQDGMIPASHAADYLAVLPDARASVLPGIGHLPHEEAPAASLVPLRGFLAP
jgi:pimeloyl-ACP methyl ester carboxylesterase